MPGRMSEPARGSLLVGSGGIPKWRGLAPLAAPPTLLPRGRATTVLNNVGTDRPATALWRDKLSQGTRAWFSRGAQIPGQNRMRTERTLVVMHQATSSHWKQIALTGPPPLSSLPLPLLPQRKLTHLRVRWSSLLLPRPPRRGRRLRDPRA